MMNDSGSGRPVVNQSADSTNFEGRTTAGESTASVRSDDVVGQDLVIPIIQEELRIRKEVVPTGIVRLRKIVHETPETVHEHLVAEDVEIERVPMDVIVDSPPPIRMDGDVTVISIVEEVLVVTKQLRLKEELRIGLRRSISDYQQEVKLRGEELVVERIDSNSHSQG
jgi:stress response protein YsnF